MYHIHKKEYVEIPVNQWVRAVGQLSNGGLHHQEFKDTYTSKIQDKTQYAVASSDSFDSPSMETVLRKMRLLSLCCPSVEELGFRTRELVEINDFDI